ncbi:MAG: S8 family peptidase [Enhygromyxa sp.]
MQRIHLDKWAKALEAGCLRAVAPLLLGAAALGTGCGDFEDVDEGEVIEASEVDIPEHEQLPTAGGDDGDDGEDEYLEVDADQPNVLVDVGPEHVAGRYIVVLKDGVDPQAAAAAWEVEPEQVYTHVLNGFAGPINTAKLGALARNPEVVSVEPDELVSVDATQTMDGGGDPWNLDRIDQVSRTLDKRYKYNATGKGVYVYILDTGIKLDHVDLQGARAAYDVFGGNGQDCHGHGTHVAGIVGGKVHGVAKQAALRSVRVVGCNGVGTWSKVLAGLDWVKQHHARLAVVNLSVSGSKLSSVNAALDSLAASRVFIAAAAGNQGKDACSYSPASAKGVFAAAASDRNDRRASYSNYGPCVSAYAPGSSVRSTWHDGGTRKLNGTSMASPHIAGAAALYKSRYGDASSSKIRSDLRAWASKSKISSNPAKTANLLLNVERL